MYGVNVARCEGRAGMAVLTLTDNKTSLSDARLKDLYQHCSQVLAPYAIPRFCRVRSEMEMTSTLKPTKTQLVEAAYDPNKCGGDQLFYLDMKSKSYLKIENSVHKLIVEGVIKF